MQSLTINKAALALGAFAGLARAQSSNTAPQNIPFNASHSHGPDGPWNFITLNMGSNPQSPVDFYPMFGSQSSLVITKAACANGNSQCISPLPNYYDSKADSQQNADVNTTQTDIGPQLPTVGNVVGTGYTTVDDVNQPYKFDNLTFVLSSNTTSEENFEQNKLKYVPVSLLSLEPLLVNGSKANGGAITPGQSTLLQAYTEDTDGSGTIALHMGSAQHNQSGSLYLGGYDQNRLIESPAIFDKVGDVNISHISFGNAAGEDPWANSNEKPISNFLQSNLDVFISPHLANFYFPQSLCNLFERYLPINYDSDSNVYLWNTSAPLYTALMSSPSYMNFTFDDNGKTSIKIPFALLNLTLSQPIKSTPTAYFPCQPHPGPGYNLGRAFLQGVMYMQSYDPTPRIIIGQAPGPSVNGSTSANPQVLDPTNPNPKPASNAPRWNDTWAAQLKPLSSAPAFTATATSTATPDANTDSGSHGLSGGAIAGIVIGVLVLCALVGAAIFFFLRRRRGTNVSVVQNHAPMQNAPYATDGAAAAGNGYPYKTIKNDPATNGLGTPAPPYASQTASSAAPVAPAFGGAQEIDGREGHVVHEADPGHELAEIPAGNGPSQGFVVEMPDTSTKAEVGGVDTQRWSRT